MSPSTLQPVAGSYSAPSPKTRTESRQPPLWWAPAAVLLYCAVFYFYGIRAGELYRNETLRAILGAEVLRSGNWVVPTLYGEPLLTKPPLMYDAIALASLPQGRVTEFTARMPSAVAATALSLLLYGYASRQLGRRGGLVVAIVTPCAYLWLEKAATAEIDMMFVTWVTAAIICFLRAVEEDGPPFASAWSIVALLCVAAGVLTKWSAFVYFYGMAIPFLIWQRRVRWLWSPGHLIGAAAGAGLCVAWLVAVVHQVGWANCWQQIASEAFPRVLHGQNLSANQLGETILHPFKVLVINLPWSAFALLALHPGFIKCWDERGRWLVCALHCWAWPNLLILTLLPEHATRHSFPICPPITALGAMVWLAAMTDRLPDNLLVWHRRLTGLTLVLLAAGLVGAGGWGFFKLPSVVWWLVIVLTLMGLWCVREGMVAWSKCRWAGTLTALVLACMVIKLAHVEVYVPVRDAPRQPRAKAAQLARHVPAGQTLYLSGVKDEGIMFYYGRPVVRLRDWNRLPTTAGPAYCILTADEWQTLRRTERWQAVLEVPLKDTQGDDVVLVALVPNDQPAVRAA